MSLLDQCVDALESAIAERGPAAVDVRDFAPSPLQHPEQTTAAVLIELLRVWMEHQWSIGSRVSAEEGLSLFPGTSFTQAQIAELRSEEKRQAAIFESVQATEPTSPILSQLPQAGEDWGDFELVTELGRGASAIVYLAKQRDLANRWVALKLTNRESFESYWLAILQHSAIVPVYSTHCHQGVYGICMPYLGNTTLADILSIHRTKLTRTKTNRWRESKDSKQTLPIGIQTTVMRRHARISTYVNADTTPAFEIENRQPGALSPNPPQGQISISLLNTSSPINEEQTSQEEYVSRIAVIGHQIAQALQYAHHRGIIHSDIKPANILLGYDGQARLLDFNVAYTKNRSILGKDKVVEESGRNSTSPEVPLGGTLAYMAPELRNELSNPYSTPINELDARIDIYSFGVLMYELLNGKLPRPSDTRKAPHQKLGWQATVSPALRAIVEKCLADNPSNRYQTAQHLAEDLAAQCESRPLVHQHEPSVVERIKKWGVRHPRLSSTLSVATIAIILLLASTSLAVWQYQRTQDLDWKNRLAQAERQLPTTLSLISALPLAPELESDATAALNSLLSLLTTADSKDGSLNWDRRWSGTTRGEYIDLQRHVHEVIWLAHHRDWRNAPDLPANSTDTTILDEQEALALIQSRQYAEAKELLEESVLQNPSHYFSWWLLGDNYLALKDFRNAERAYSVCIALQPKLAVCFFLRGNARLGEQHYDDAQRDFQIASQLSPKWAQCHFNRAVCLQRLARHSEALAETDLAQEDGLATVSLFRLRGEIYFEKGATAQSNENFRLALETEPASEAEAIDRGLLYLERDPMQAQRDFQTALKINPNSNEARQKLAYLFSEVLHDSERAIEQLEQLAIQQPSELTHRASKAVLFARNKRATDALQELASLEKLAVGEPIVAYQIACAYCLLANQETGDNKKHANRALFWLIRSASADPNLIPIILTDPDSQWLRKQTEFNDWFEAVKLVHPHLFAKTNPENSP